MQVSKDKPKAKRRKLSKMDYTAYAMLLPQFILFCVIGIYPILWGLRYMFYEYDGITKPIFIGMENFVRAFTRDPAWWKSVVNTFVYAGGKLIIEIPLAILVATMLNQKIKGIGLFRGIFYLPVVTSAAVMGLVFSFLFSSYNGIINIYLQNIGLIDKALPWLEDKVLAMVVIIVVSVWQNFGQNVLLILAGMQNLPMDVYESADIDGANRIQIFFKITLPLLAPMLQMVLMLAIIGSLQGFDTIFVLTGGGPNDATQIMGLSIYNKFFASDVAADYGYGACLAFLAACIIGVFTAVYLRVSKKMNYQD